MTKGRSTLGLTGYIFILIGSVILVFYGSFLIFIVLTGAISSADRYNYRIFPFIGFDDISYGILYAIIGLIAIWIFLNEKIYQHDRELLWAIVFIILGLIAESIGGLFLFIGGTIIFIDYFF